MLSRSSKTIIFQNKGTEFRIKVNLSKKESIEAIPPHMQNVQFYLFQSERIAVMGFRKETIKTEGHKPLLDGFQLLASVDAIEFQTTEAHSSLDLINVTCNLSIHSRDETLKVIVQIRPKNREKDHGRCFLRGPYEGLYE
jgi:hypothetical protein